MDDGVREKQNPNWVFFWFFFFSSATLYLIFRKNVKTKDADKQANQLFPPWVTVGYVTCLNKIIYLCKFLHPEVTRRESKGDIKVYMEIVGTLDLEHCLQGFGADVVV